jgi:hypothetical protein
VHRGRADVDDFTPAPFPHKGHRGLGHAPAADDVDVEAVGPLFLGPVAPALEVDVAVEGGVIDQDVNTAELLLGQFGDGVALFLAGDVQLYPERLTAPGDDFFSDRFGPLGVSLPDDHRGAFRRQSQGNCLADSLPSAGNNGYLIF